MRTISYRLGDLRKAVLEIGYVAENEHTRVQIDAGEVYAEYPHASVALTVQPPKGTPYPAVVTRDGNIVIWDIKDSDLAYRGAGEIQLTWSEGDVVVKSCISRININRSIVGSGTAPDPLEDFLAEAGEALTAIPETIDAAFDAITAEAETLPAGSSATASFDGETKKLTIGVPKGDTGAQGPEGPAGQDGAPGKDGKDGADGAPGKDGKDGADGHTPVKGTDYWTAADKAEIVADAAADVVADIIDDNAGDGDTNKTWSADKLAEMAEDVSETKSAMSSLQGDVSVLTQETDFIHNALGKAGQFSPSTSWYRMWGCSTYSASDGVASFLCSNQYGGIKTSVDIVVPANHKIYAFAKLKGIGARLTFASNKYANSVSADDFNFVSFIESWSEQSTRNLQIVDVSSSNFQTLYAKECGVINITATFGDVVPTKEQLDAFVTQVGFFENFPVGTFLRKFYTDYIKAGANGYPNLGDKTIVIMGDSITMQNTIDGNGNLTKTNTNWPDYAMPLLGDPTVYNLAQDGSSYHDFSGSGTYQTFTKQYNLMVSKGWNPDIIILAFGTNDYQYTHTDDYATAMNIYSLSGLDKTNNYQSIRWAYWTLTQNYPNALIIVSTPIQRADVGVTSTNYIREAITQMARPYCMNVVDAMLESGIMGQYEKAPGYGAGRYLADGLHPNTAGKKLLGRYWAYKIAQYFSPDKFDKSDVS